MLKSKGGSLMQGESTSSEHSMTYSRGRVYTFFKVPPIFLNKTVTLNVLCTLLWTNQKLCSMKPAFLIVGGNSQLHMLHMFTITHPYNVTTGI